MPPTNTFTLVALPGTDIWRKPPTTDIFNAPTALPSTTPGQGQHQQRTTGPLSSFLSARLSFRFTPTRQYDQAGLLLSFRPPSSSSSSETPPPKWIKSGVELYHALPRLSTVACDAWADWSVSDLPSSSSSSTAGDGDGEVGWITVQIEKDKDGNGTGLWVYRVKEESGEKVPLREICWVFAAGMEGWEVDVCGMAARPAEDNGGGGLEVEFGGLEVRWVE